jgi:hypothetical protein
LLDHLARERQLRLPPEGPLRSIQLLVQHLVDLGDVFDDPDLGLSLDLGKLLKLLGAQMQRRCGIGFRLEAGQRSGDHLLDGRVIDGLRSLLGSLPELAERRAILREPGTQGRRWRGSLQGLLWRIPDHRIGMLELGRWGMPFTVATTRLHRPPVAPD